MAAYLNAFTWWYVPANLLLLYFFVFDAIIWHNWSPNIEVEPKKSHAFEIDPINFLQLISRQLQWFTINYKAIYNDLQDNYKTIYNQLQSITINFTTIYNAYYN